MKYIINNYSHKDIIRRRREAERCHLLAQKRSFHLKLSQNQVPTVLAVRDLSLGARNFNNTVRTIYENRLLHVGSVPNAVQETYLSSSSEHVKGCQFLDIVGSGDDAQILGCWAIGDGSRNSRKASKLACLRARFNDEVARKAAIEMDKQIRPDANISLNVLVFALIYLFGLAEYEVLTDLMPLSRVSFNVKGMFHFAPF
ncbi:unnamed protein product [Strongylus vulgaris]|uniref:Uncharacterized protein n=1 Tax=Strongylus vulgaris TaxID=40348 RepID=A0A3P7IA59_STRVU|nr:unnamed protein product [Strongylus vulgaris]